MVRKGSIALLCITFASLTGCVSTHPPSMSRYYAPNHRFLDDYSSRVPEEFQTNGHKTVLVDPTVFAWGAYDEEGRLVRAGIATSGGTTCPPDADAEDLNCKTTAGIYKITSMGDGNCYSKKYPRPTGGGLMPYCMFFNNGQALHGSPDSIVMDDNLSHGCVRMRIQDAEWMHDNFAQVGTRVVVMPY